MRTTDAFRLVLDTNVVFAALANPRSASRAVLEAALTAPELALFVSPFLLREYRSVLPHLRFRAPPDRIEAWLGLIEQRAALVHPTRQPDLPVADPDDAHVLACATAADADYLVTNDAGHFPREPVGRTVIARPSAMRRILAEAGIV